MVSTIEGCGFIDGSPGRNMITGPDDLSRAAIGRFSNPIAVPDCRVFDFDDWYYGCC